MSLLSEYIDICDLVGMPGMPYGKRSDKLSRWIKDRGITTRLHKARSGQNRRQALVKELPDATRAALLMLHNPHLVPSAPSKKTVDELWAAYEKATPKAKEEAALRLRIIIAIDDLVRTGVSKVKATHLVVEQNGVSYASVYRWRAQLKAARIPNETHRLAALIPHYDKSPKHQAECSQEAWDYLYAVYARPEKQSLAVCYRLLQRAAGAQGWTVPSKKYFERRLKRLDPMQLCVAREGLEEARRRYPAQERDKMTLHAMEAVNADGHKFDVFVRWPDGTKGRPLMVAWQDIHSGKLLSWRIGRSETAELYRLSFGDLVEQYGIPLHAVLDNGRGAAAKELTAGAETRYRFKILEDDPLGLYPLLGVTPHFAQIYHGQSKPIERYFRDVCDAVARHFAFSGAYTGNNPMNKPSNYGQRAVPLDEFLAVVRTEIAALNAQQGRRSKVADGRSLDDAFNESYATAPIRKATGEQRKLWLLKADNVRVRQDGCIRLNGQRYFAPAVARFAGQKIVIRFDPTRPELNLHCYQSNGDPIGEVSMLSPVGFFDKTAAGSHAEQLHTRVNEGVDAHNAALKLDIAQVAALTPGVPEPSLATAKVIKPYFSKTKSPVAVIEPPDDEDDVFEEAVKFYRDRIAG